MNNLKKKTMYGMLSMSMSSILVFALQFVTTIILARIFTPTEFGVVSAIMIVTSYTDIFWKIGIGPAIVQKKDLNEMDIRTGYSSSIILGLFTTILIFGLSYPISRIVNISDPRLIQLISLSFIINSFSIVNLSLLQKNMKFRIIIKKDIFSNIVYMVVAVMLGLLGFGSYGLVLALLARYIFGVLIIIIASNRKIRFGFEKESFKKMMGFGFGYSISQFLSVTTSQGDYFVVTRVLGAYSLGIYSKAYQLMSVPANLLGQVIDQVFFPMMSQIQEDNKQLSNIFILSTSLLAIVYFPIGIGIFIFSPYLVTFLLGEIWIEAAVPLSILSLSMFFRVGYKISDPLFRAKGAVYNRAYIHLIHAIITLVAAFLGSKWGLTGISIAVSISLFINYLMIIFKTYKLIKFDIKLFIKAIIPIILMSMLILLAMLFINATLQNFIKGELILLSIELLIFIGLSLMMVFVVYYQVWPKIIKNQVDKIINQLLINVKNRVIKKGA